jgi:hypothetical protein
MEVPMRSWFISSTLVALFALLASPLSAATLQAKQQETSFSASYVDTDDVGKTIQADGQWEWIFGKGYNEVGGVLSYLKLDPDSGSSSDATIVGPIYTFNWMPANDKVTGFVEASYGFVSGDLGDFFDDALEASIGAKVFVGNSAAVRFDYFVQKLQGAEGFEDQDSHGIRVGISIFGGSK